MADCSKCCKLTRTIKKKTKILKHKSKQIDLYKELCSKIDFKKLRAKKFDKNIQCFLEQATPSDHELLVNQVNENEKFVEELLTLRSTVSELKRKLPEAELKFNHIDFVNKQICAYHKQNELTLEQFKRDLIIVTSSLLKYDANNSKAKACIQYISKVGGQPLTKHLNRIKSSEEEPEIKKNCDVLLKHINDSPAHSSSSSSGIGSDISDIPSVNSESSDNLNKGNSENSLKQISSLSPTYSFHSAADSVIDSDEEINPDSSQNKSVDSQTDNFILENNKPTSIDDNTNLENNIIESLTSSSHNVNLNETNENLSLQDFEFDGFLPVTSIDNLNCSIFNIFPDNTGFDSVLEDIDVNSSDGCTSKIKNDNIQESVVKENFIQDNNKDSDLNITCDSRCIPPRSEKLPDCSNLEETVSAMAQEPLISLVASNFVSKKSTPNDIPENSLSDITSIDVVSDTNLEKHMVKQVVKDTLDKECLIKDNIIELTRNFECNKTSENNSTTDSMNCKTNEGKDCIILKENSTMSENSKMNKPVPEDTPVEITCQSNSETSSLADESDLDVDQEPLVGIVESNFVSKASTPNNIPGNNSLTDLIDAASDTNLEKHMVKKVIIGTIDKESLFNDKRIELPNKITCNKTYKNNLTPKSIISNSSNDTTFSKNSKINKCVSKYTPVEIMLQSNSDESSDDSDRFENKSEICENTLVTKHSIFEPTITSPLFQTSTDTTPKEPNKCAPMDLFNSTLKEFPSATRMKSSNSMSDMESCKPLYNSETSSENNKYNNVSTDMNISCQAIPELISPIKSMRNFIEDSSDIELLERDQNTEENDTVQNNVSGELPNKFSLCKSLNNSIIKKPVLQNLNPKFEPSKKAGPSEKLSLNMSSTDIFGVKKCDMSRKAGSSKYQSSLFVDCSESPQTTNGTTKTKVLYPNHDTHKIKSEVYSSFSSPEESSFHSYWYKDRQPRCYDGKTTSYDYSHTEICKSCNGHNESYGVNHVNYANCTMTENGNPYYYPHRGHDNKLLIPKQMFNCSQNYRNTNLGCCRPNIFNEDILWRTWQDKSNVPQDNFEKEKKSPSVPVFSQLAPRVINIGAITMKLESVSLDSVTSGNETNLFSEAIREFSFGSLSSNIQQSSGCFPFAQSSPSPSSLFKINSNPFKEADKQLFTLPNKSTIRTERHTESIMSISPINTKSTLLKTAKEGLNVEDQHENLPNPFLISSRNKIHNAIKQISCNIKGNNEMNLSRNNISSLNINNSDVANQQPGSTSLCKKRKRSNNFLINETINDDTIHGNILEPVDNISMNSFEKRHCSLSPQKNESPRKSRCEDDRNLRNDFAENSREIRESTEIPLPFCPTSKMQRTVIPHNFPSEERLRSLAPKKNESPKKNCFEDNRNLRNDFSEIGESNEIPLPLGPTSRVHRTVIPPKVSSSEKRLSSLSPKEDESPRKNSSGDVRNDLSNTISDSGGSNEIPFRPKSNVHRTIIPHTSPSKNKENGKVSSLFEKNVEYIEPNTLQKKIIDKGANTKVLEKYEDNEEPYFSPGKKNRISHALKISEHQKQNEFVLQKATDTPVVTCNRISPKSIKCSPKIFDIKSSPKERNLIVTQNSIVDNSDEMKINLDYNHSSNTEHNEIHHDKACVKSFSKNNSKETLLKISSSIPAKKDKNNRKINEMPNTMNITKDINKKIYNISGNSIKSTINGETNHSSNSLETTDIKAGQHSFSESPIPLPSIKKRISHFSNVSEDTQNDKHLIINDTVSKSDDDLGIDISPLKKPVPRKKCNRKSKIEKIEDLSSVTETMKVDVSTESAFKVPSNKPVKKNKKKDTSVQQNFEQEEEILKKIFEDMHCISPLSPLSEDESFNDELIENKEWDEDKNTADSEHYQNTEKEVAMINNCSLPELNLEWDEIETEVENDVPVHEKIGYSMVTKTNQTVPPYTKSSISHNDNELRNSLDPIEEKSNHNANVQLEVPLENMEVDNTCNKPILKLTAVTEEKVEYQELQDVKQNNQEKVFKEFNGKSNKDINENSDLSLGLLSVTNENPYGLSTENSSYCEETKKIIGDYQSEILVDKGTVSPIKDDIAESFKINSLKTAKTYSKKKHQERKSITTPDILKLDLCNSQNEKLLDLPLIISENTELIYSLNEEIPEVPRTFIETCSDSEDNFGKLYSIIDSGNTKLNQEDSCSENNSNLVPELLSTIDCGNTKLAESNSNSVETSRRIISKTEIEIVKPGHDISNPKVDSEILGATIDFGNTNLKKNNNSSESNSKINPKMKNSTIDNGNTKFVEENSNSNNVSENEIVKSDQDLLELLPIKRESTELNQDYTNSKIDSEIKISTIVCGSSKVEEDDSNSKECSRTLRSKTYEDSNSTVHSRTLRSTTDRKNRKLDQDFIKMETSQVKPKRHKIPQVAPNYRKSNYSSPFNASNLNHHASRLYSNLPNDSLIPNNNIPHNSTRTICPSENHENVKITTNSENEGQSTIKPVVVPVFQGFYTDIKEKLSGTIEENSITSNDSSNECTTDFKKEQHTDVNFNKRQLIDEVQDYQFEANVEPPMKKHKPSDLENKVDCKKDLFYSVLNHIIANSNFAENDKNGREEYVNMIKQQNLEQFQIKAEISKVIHSEDTFLVVNRVVESMKLNTMLEVKPKPFVKAICDILLEDKKAVIHEKPFMSKTIVSCTGFTMAYVGPHSNEFLLDVLRAIEEILGAYHNTNTPTVPMAVKLISYYTTLCRAYSLEQRLKLTLVDLLYSRPERYYGLFVKVLQIWPEILVHRNQCTLRDCLLTQTMISIILTKDSKLISSSNDFQKIYSTTNLKSILRYKYGYVCNQFTSNYIQLADKCIKRISEEGSRRALILLCHTLGLNWSKSIVDKKLFPLLRGWMEGKVPDFIAEDILTTTATIIRGMPAGKELHFIKQSMDLFEEILHKSPDDHFTEKVVEALSLLRRHNLTMVATILMKFTPSSNTMTEKTIAYVRRILSAQKLNPWLKIYVASKNV